MVLGGCFCCEQKRERRRERERARLCVWWGQVVRDSASRLLEKEILDIEHSIRKLQLEMARQTAEILRLEQVQCVCRGGGRKRDTAQILRLAQVQCVWRGGGRGGGDGREIEGGREGWKGKEIEGGGERRGEGVCVCVCVCVRVRVRLCACVRKPALQGT